MNWKLENGTLYAAQDGYSLTVKLGAALGLPYWCISKEGFIVDECYRHKPTTGELSARIQCEKAFANILELTPKEK